MFNSNEILSALSAALREGGEAKVREVAAEHASRLGQYNESAFDAIIAEILEALAEFDRDKALAVINGAQDRLTNFEEDDEDEEGEDAEDGDAPDLASRVTALEKTVADLRSLATRHGLR